MDTKTTSQADRGHVDGDSSTSDSEYQHALEVRQISDQIIVPRNVY